MNRFNISLLIRHPTIDPNEISTHLEMQPYSHGKAGEQITTPKGTRVPSVRKHSTWNHVLEYNGDTGLFDELEKLLIQLSKHKEFFKKLIKEGGYIEIILSIPGDKHQGSSSKTEILQLMADLNFNLGVEIFPDME